jgi:N-hydroxyarylamine O-acetyltransferase
MRSRGGSTTTRSPVPRSEPAVAYLRRLGFAPDADLPPTLDTLVAVHGAHLDAVPYESLATMLGRPPSADPIASLDRVGRIGRAGYCFHQNGALEAVLRELGFAVTRRHAHVYSTEDDRDDRTLNHLALVVDGLPTEANPGGRWWADVGLGDCFRDPLPVLVGRYEQGGFGYQITEVREDGWSFRADPAGSFLGIEVTSLPIDQAAVDEAHVRLTTPITGRFTQLLVVQKRHADAAETLRGCLLVRVDRAGRTETELTTYDQWRSALADGLGLSLVEIDDAELRALYDAQWAKHLAWTATGRP